MRILTSCLVAVALCGGCGTNDDDGRLQDGGEALSCGEAVGLWKDAVDDRVAGVDNTCATDDDCALMNLTVGCGAGRPIQLNLSSIALRADATQPIEDGLGSLRGEICLRLEPGCIVDEQPVGQEAAVCDGGQCRRLEFTPGPGGSESSCFDRARSWAQSVDTLLADKTACDTASDCTLVETGLSCGALFFAACPTAIAVAASDAVAGGLETLRTDACADSSPLCRASSLCPPPDRLRAECVDHVCRAIDAPTP
ncbi:MAG: hypothetical protein KC543_12955 [Myxococcales bacterium]|nr:hypothetical protein [Myxococcales bacterium]